MMRSSPNKPFRVDLVRQQGLCELNYARLLQLLPEVFEKDLFLLWVAHGGAASASRVTIRVLQRTPYTTLINIDMAAFWPEWVSLPELEVRLYHDVLMAEVVMAQKVKLFPVPGQPLFVATEKLMLSQFLAELLGFCMSGGHVPEPVFRP